MRGAAAEMTDLSFNFLCTAVQGEFAADVAVLPVSEIAHPENGELEGRK